MNGKKNKERSLQMPPIKAYKGFERPVTKGQDVFQEIYEWTYIDEDGKLKKDKKNVQEEIQSYLPRTDYKAQIQRGELELTENAGIYQDFRNIPDDTVAIYDYLNTLANLPQEQVTKLLEQVNARNKESIQAKQTTDSKAIGGGQIVKENVSNQSTNAEINKNTVGTGEQE
jgi:hypothetical protein